MYSGCRFPGSRFKPRARRERDLGVKGVSSLSSGFQTTRPQGARHRPARSRVLHHRVSNHAPAGSATRLRSVWRRRPPSFKPRARRERDLFKTALAVDDLVFQTTRPQGARPFQDFLMSQNQVFQTTRPQGARQSGVGALPGLALFQTTRPQGARQCSPRLPLDRTWFQTTRPQGARHLPLHLPQDHECFKPRARRERDCHFKIARLTRMQRHTSANLLFCQLFNAVIYLTNSPLFYFQ